MGFTKELFYIDYREARQQGDCLQASANKLGEKYWRLGFKW